MPLDVQPGAQIDEGLPIGLKRLVLGRSFAVDQVMDLSANTQ